MSALQADLGLGQGKPRERPLADAVVSCSDNLAFMRKLPDASMKLIVTSPPYNLGKEYEKRQSRDEYLQQQRRVIEEAARLLAPEGSVCWQVGNYVDNGEIEPLDILLYPIFKDQGLKLRNRIIWTYGHGLHCQNRFSGRYETILWFTRTDNYTFNLDDVRVPSKYPQKKHFRGPRKGELSGNPLGKNPSDVWDIPNVKANHVEKTEHPCQFPVGLIERLVLALTDPGDAVLDPYMGVGSSLIAALKHDRHAYGCDIHRQYVDTARDRIKALRAGSLRLRPMDRPIYEPPVREAG